MSKLDDIRDNLSGRSKSLLMTAADIIESITQQNLALASDLAGFAIDQVRLPTQSDDFGDYRDRSKDAYSKFGGQLKAHGEDLVSVLREVPGQVKDALSAASPAAKAKPVRKAAAKKAPAQKKAVANEPAAKKKVAKQASAAKRPATRKKVARKKAA
jgi:hypothetical protein